MAKKTDKQILFERMNKVAGMPLNENAFNDAGEPNMTHSQFRDYSEPAEPEYDDNAPIIKKGPFGFGNIDWKIVYDELVHNTKTIRQNPESTDVSTYSDFTDQIEGMMSSEELDMLKHGSTGDDWGIWHDNKIPFFDVKELSNIPSYEEFIGGVKRIYDSPPTSEKTRP